MITLFNTHIDKSALKIIRKTLKSTFISEGRFVKDFELNLKKKLKWTNPITVNSGTSALHLALIVSGIKKNDEVIIPAQTFIATGFAVLYQGAIPVFTDIQYETGNIDPKSIKKKITKKTKAIIPVHWGGYPCDLDEIEKIANEYKLTIIEDAAHACGATYKMKPVGSISDITCFSFQAIKHLTTADGGAVCCKDYKMAQEAYRKRWFGIDRNSDKQSILGEREYNLKEIGYKYHMNDYQASLGLGNLTNIKRRIQRRRQIADIYNSHLKNISGLKLFNYKDDRQSSFWLYGMHVENRFNFINAMKSRGIEVSVVHQGIYKNEVFGGLRKDIINKRKFDKSQIHIPIHENLSLSQVDYIANSIKKGW